MTESSYIFENMSRIGNDDCYLDQTSIQNVNSCNYTLQNYFASNCSMQKQIDLATTQPGIFYKGTHSIGSLGCNVDDNSNLTLGTIQTNPKCRIDLNQRPFLTIPFLGRGSVSAVTEAQLQQGEALINKKTSNHMSEKSYIKYHHTPLLPEISKKVNTPAIEDNASEGWIRGGIPSRELTRDSDYFSGKNK
jgi:hypothetical protein